MSKYACGPYAACPLSYLKHSVQGSARRSFQALPRALSQKAWPGEVRGCRGAPSIGSDCRPLVTALAGVAQDDACLEPARLSGKRRAQLQLSLLFGHHRLDNRQPQPKARKSGFPPEFSAADPRCRAAWSRPKSGAIPVRSRRAAATFAWARAPSGKTRDSAACWKSSPCGWTSQKTP